MNTGQEINRGEAAKRLLNDPLMEEAITYMHDHLIHQFEMTKLSQAAEREEIFRLLQTLIVFQRYLKDIIATGEMASIKVKERNTKRP